MNFMKIFSEVTKQKICVCEFLCVWCVSLWASVRDGVCACVCVCVCCWVVGWVGVVCRRGGEGEEGEGEKERRGEGPCVYIIQIYEYRLNKKLRLIPLYLQIILFL